MTTIDALALAASCSTLSVSFAAGCFTSWVEAAGRPRNKQLQARMERTGMRWLRGGRGTLASPEARSIVDGIHCRRAAPELPRLFAIVPQNPLGDQGGLGLVLHIDADDPGQLHRFADFVPGLQLA